MLDAEFRSFFVTLVVDLSVFVACGLIFVVVRKKWHTERTPLLPSANVFENSDVRLYLTFLQLMGLLFGLMTVFGLIVLLPLHETATWEIRASILGNASAENYRQRDVKGNSLNFRLYALFAMMMLFTSFTYVAIQYFHRAILETELEAFPTETQRVSHHCVMVKNLHRRQTNPDALKQALFGEDPSGLRYKHLLLQTTIVHDFQDFYDAESKLQATADQVERYRVKETSLVRGYGIIGPKQNAVHRFSEELIYRKKVLDRLLKDGHLHSAGVAFLIFATPEAQQDVLRDPNVLARTRAQRWSILPAPPPGDLQWENLSVSTRQQRAREIAFSSLIFLLCWVLVCPVTLWDRLHFLLGVDQLNNDSLFRALILGYLPPLVILGINSLVIPQCIWYAAKWEGWWRKSENQRRILDMNLAFMVINSMVIPLTCFNSLQALVEHMMLTPMTQWNTSLGGTFLNSSGSFALRYMINTSFLSTAAQLLQIPQTVATKYHLAFAVIERDEVMANRRWPFDFGFWYACCLSAFYICISFSVVVPLILPCGTIFFFLKYYLDRYNFAHGVFAVDMESQGALARAVEKYMWSGISFFHFCMSGAFIVQECKILGCVALLTSFCFGVRAFAPLPAATNTPMYRGSVRNNLLLEDAYLHPYEKARQTYVCDFYKSPKGLLNTDFRKE